MGILIDLNNFKTEILAKHVLHMMIENDFFYQGSQLVENIWVNDSTIFINNVKILTKGIEIYKKNNEYYLTHRADNTRVILY
ncbi:hypothetical protein [Bacillus paranthracis]|uniref:hypothetical protein n=1 Tax=Bacillus paranthracis TaxID=2026186 RepID=UPI000279FCD5|nr:hypothetical protein [Bacillus paranthracis]EJR47064.1 hypothetical protein IIK_03904 [Bacillus cereus VD102]OUA62275.1 hypothetical protein BK786_28390 [Bacillus thuringiensis serovar thailandensis]MCC2499431.1 hypothetical protein [Bacillus paranthracis]MDF9581700.1 hypothetical protein [Bacillus paranthracis]MDG1612380.1 hypothetical protein [Bacillus paranthracis]